MSSHENAASHEACRAAAPSSEAGKLLRIVLLGRTGTGRSSSGNTILGRSVFGMDMSPCSVTTRCQRRTETVDGRSISVIDTPGFFHTHLSPDEVRAEIGRCVVLSSPGPHAFLVTLRPGRFTQEERDALEWIRDSFGPSTARFTTVVFTCGDQLQGKQIGDFLVESEALSAFVSSCSGGYHVLDNSSETTTTTTPTKRSQQVAQLLKKIDQMVESNRGGCYSDQMFKEAQRTVRKAQERILGERGGGGGGLMVEPSRQKADHKEEQQAAESEIRKRREEEEEARKRAAERLFWCELGTAVGQGAAEGAGIAGKDDGTGKAVTKVKMLEKAAALAASPLSITSAAKAVGGAVREGSKVLYKHRKTFLR